jgi:hypothetical protein
MLGPAVEATLSDAATTADKLVPDPWLRGVGLGGTDSRTRTEAVLTVSLLSFMRTPKLWQETRPNGRRQTSRRR